MPISDFAIRDFAWGDIPAIAVIYDHYVATSTATFDLEPPGETYLAHKWGHMVDLGHPALVVERAGKLIGFAYASEYRSRPAYRFTCEDSIYLAPEATGQGLGGILLDELVNRSRAVGFKQMIGVISDEMENSIRLHEKHGFSVLGRFPALGYKFDRWIGIVHVQREL